MIHAKTAFILLCAAVAATIVATCLLGLGAFGDGPAEAATAIRAELPQPVTDHLLSDTALDHMTALAMTAPVSGMAACVANSVRDSEQCLRRCDGRRWKRIEYNSGVCGFESRCECSEAAGAPFAIEGSTKH